MIGYPSGQDEAIFPARDYAPCPARKNSPWINLLLTKTFRSRWLDIGLVLLLRVHGPRLDLGLWSRKRKDLGQYSVILIARLVNNPYIHRKTCYNIALARRAFWLANTIDLFARWLHSRQVVYLYFSSEMFFSHVDILRNMIPNFFFKKYGKMAV